MYILTLVSDVQKVVEQLRGQRGDFTLAMLYNTGPLESASGWNLIVSAPWTDAMRIAEAIRIIAHALNQGLGLENKGAISRITVLRSSDAFVRDMRNHYQGASGIPLSQISAGEEIGSGYIFYLQKPSLATL